MLAQEIRPHATRGIAALRAVFDLDDLCAEVGEIHRPERSGSERLEGQNANACERQR
jgi:hypothetical protein